MSSTLIDEVTTPLRVRHEAIYVRRDARPAVGLPGPSTTQLPHPWHCQPVTTARTTEDRS